MSDENEYIYDLDKLDNETFNSMVKANKEYPEIESIKFLDYHSNIDFEKITIFKNLKEFIFEEGWSSSQERWSWDERLQMYREDKNIDAIDYDTIKTLSEENFIPMKEVLKLKKLEWASCLVVEKFTDLLQLPNLEYVHKLCILECNYSVEPKPSNKELMELCKRLPNIKIDNLEIRFMRGDVSFFKYLNTCIKSITIDIVTRLNNFDFEFAQKTKGFHLHINQFYVERSNEGKVSREDILSDDNKKIILDKEYDSDGRPLTQSTIDFIYEDEDVTIQGCEYEHINLSFLPIIKSKNKIEEVEVKKT